MKPPNEMPESPYVIWEPKLGTFEYGTARMILGRPVKNRLGVAFSMEAATAALINLGFDLSQPCLTGTRPASSRGKTQ